MVPLRGLAPQRRWLTLTFLGAETSSSWTISVTTMPTGLRLILKAVGVRPSYLPPNSPELTPIEKAFSKIKHWLRLFQKRTPKGRSSYVGNLFKTIRNPKIWA